MVTLRQAERLAGLPYVDGDFDCMHLAVRAARELFGREVPWPHRRHPTGVKAQRALMSRHADALTVKLAATEPPCEGDVVAWSMEADRPSWPRRWHVGTVLLRRGEVWVLHTSVALGSSVLQRLCDVPPGMRLEGFYRWR